jgi:hypothetical protein
MMSGRLTARRYPIIDRVAARPSTLHPTPPQRFYTRTIPSSYLMKKKKTVPIQFPREP